MVMRALRTRPAESPMPGPFVPDDPVVMYEGTQVVALADRRSNDIDVVLLWAQRTGRLWVNVTHRATGRIARIDATPGNALDAFHHPFAHAAD
jgi:hypothetical protein